MRNKKLNLILGVLNSLILLNIFIGTKVLNP